MPKLYSSVFILYILERNGFYFVSQKGSHIKYRKDGEVVLTVIIPANRKQIPVGTFNSIVRQCGLIKSDFEQF
jgi:predicted RNA binding protein YcfA (HicA-like mRNA interferase family)